MNRQAQYRIRKSENLFNEMNDIGMRLKKLRDMVEGSRRVTKREWEEFLADSLEIQNLINEWREKVIRLKERVNEEELKPSLYEDY